MSEKESKNTEAYPNASDKISEGMVLFLKKNIPPNEWCKGEKSLSINDFGKDGRDQMEKRERGEITGPLNEE